MATRWGVARQIGEHGLRPAKRLLCIDHPFDLAQRREKSSEYGSAGECGVVAEELEAVGLVGCREHLQEEPAEQPRKHANGEEEGRAACDPALALVAQAAAGARSCARADGGSLPSASCAARR